MKISICFIFFTKYRKKKKENALDRERLTFFYQNISFLSMVFYFALPFSLKKNMKKNCNR